MDIIGTSFFWVTLAQIIMINIVLSGDNAVVIALASRSLPEKQQKRAILFGSAGAIVLRVVLTFFAVMLLGIPYLKLIGAVLLGWIGIQMLGADDGDEEVSASTQLWAAIKTIIVADFIMSLDNVLGVAAAAKGSVLLLVIGLGISIPLIVYGSTLVLKMMTRWPVIVTIGGGVLGWVAGEMAVSDTSIIPWVESHAWLHDAAPAMCAGAVVAMGKTHAAATVAAARRALEEPPEPEAPAGYRWRRPVMALSHDGRRDLSYAPLVAVPVSSRLHHRGRWQALRESWEADRGSKPRARGVTANA